MSIADTTLSWRDSCARAARVALSGLEGLARVEPKRDVAELLWPHFVIQARHSLKALKTSATAHR
jgi:hypothetical protein